MQNTDAMQPLDLETKEWNNLLVCTVGYCLKQPGYRTRIMVETIKTNLPMLDNQTLWEIRTELHCNKAGMKYSSLDEPVWIEFRRAVTQELKRRGIKWAVNPFK